MFKGVKVRQDIHKILFLIYKYNNTLNHSNIKNIIRSHNKKDVSLLNNVTLNSMRLHIHCLKIIKKYIKKKIRDHEKILLISAITQIVFLDFKEYAVINCSVEIAKKLKLYAGLINASLKRIAKDKIALKEIKIQYSDFPVWFKKETKNLSTQEKRKFLNNFFKEPDLHIVFKTKKYLNQFNEDIIKTSDVSGFLLNKENLKDKKGFAKGDWWVQDFSSFLPLHNFKIENKNQKFLDACAAPGGKSFQLLTKNKKVILNDKNAKRIQILKTNLRRLNFNPIILNKDFTKFNENEKYDVVILDTPCSSVGTIRKNPEIFFKIKSPNFNQLNNLQQTMLQKASTLVNKNGFVIYMTCSFIQSETFNQVNQFLKKNNNFILSSFDMKNEGYNYSKLIKNNFMITLPNYIFNKNIDGYFAVYLKKIK